MAPIRLSTCQLQLPQRHEGQKDRNEREREKQRENKDGKKTVDVFVKTETLSAKAHFSVCKFKTLTDILFIYPSSRHLVQSVGWWNMFIVILYTDIKMNYWGCQKSQFGISGLLETWITLKELLGAISCFCFLLFFKEKKKKFQNEPHLLQLFIRMLWHCFSVKLQKY